MKIVLMFRNLRSAIATWYLRRKCIRCGGQIRAARIPHIGSQVKLEIGNHTNFNGFTATGWGGVKLVITFIQEQM